MHTLLTENVLQATRFLVNAARPPPPTRSATPTGRSAFPANAGGPPYGRASVYMATGGSRTGVAR
jgi:hypothetical protein